MFLGTLIAVAVAEYVDYTQITRNPADGSDIQLEPKVKDKPFAKSKIDNGAKYSGR